MDDSSGGLRTILEAPPKLSQAEKGVGVWAWGCVCRTHSTKKGMKKREYGALKKSFGKAPGSYQTSTLPENHPRA